MTLYKLDGIDSARGEFKLAIQNCLLEAGLIYSVVGPNGSGKTTLLDTLAFLRPPAAGTVLFRDRPVDHSVQAALLSLRRQIGYLMQNPYLFNRSVAENIGYGLKVRGIPADLRMRRVETVMAQLSLSHLAGRNAHRLSGGETQRVALARTLVLDCDILLLDEPTANVDRRSVRELESVILQLNRERKTTIILTTHSQDQAYRMSRNVLSIFNGKISGVAYENVFEGPLVELEGAACAVAVAHGIEFALGTRPPGRTATIAIDPESIILSRKRLQSSALNAFEGIITRAEAAGGPLRIFVDIGVSLCAVVTEKSFDEIGLNVGKRVCVTFKANAVKPL